MPVKEKEVFTLPVSVIHQKALRALYPLKIWKNDGSQLR